ncbi:MAG: hypothetical protein IJX08_10055 [Clostridia bacterium]|nr:hypothetical protein [Clostridia bacterium]MBQ8400288.1 hypothetical protein [Clostridia bacterium]
MKAKKILLYPMNAALIYLLFTIVIFLYGPIEWNIPSVPKLVSVLLIYTGTFALGYYLKASQLIAQLKTNEKNKNRFSDFERTSANFLNGIPTSAIGLIFSVSCIFSILKHCIVMLHYYGSIDFSALLSFDFSEAYFSRLNSNIAGTWYIFALNCMNVLDVFWYPLGMIYFKRFHFGYKALFILTLLINFTYNAQSGTMISWGNFIFRLIPFLFLEIFNAIHSKNRTVSKSGKRTICIILVLIMLFVSLFIFSQESRYDYMGYEDELSYDNGILDRFIENERSYPIVGKRLSSVAFYIGNGYCGLAYALELPPSFTYGIGFSRDLSRTINQYFGIDVSGITYPQRTEDAFGWKNGIYWPSAYSWFASDLTFFGIPFLMFFFGQFFCSVWFNALTENSITAVVLTGWLWIGILFIPANNQLFQSFNMFAATVGLILLYIFRKKLPTPVLKQTISK